MKKHISKLLVAFVALIAGLQGGAETFDHSYTVTECTDTDATYALITEMLVGDGVALKPSGDRLDVTNPIQVGIFSNLVAKVIPSFTNGVILSTGNIDGGPSISNTVSGCRFNKSDSIGSQSDSDLNKYYGRNEENPLIDPAGLVLYIQPKNKTLNIPFVMASEEFFYNPYKEEEEQETIDAPSQQYYKSYSDKFAFFLQDLGAASDVLDDDQKVKNSPQDAMIYEGSQTRNIALLPDGGNVEIATVNQHTNQQYFISNVEIDETDEEEKKLEFPAGNINLPMEFNGAIVGPVAVANVDPNRIYKLKIVIGDDNDNSMNSVVFLRERGITSGADLAVDVSAPAYLETEGDATITVAVANVGPATADGVVVTNTLPTGVKLEDVTSEKWSVSVGTVEKKAIDGVNCFVWTIGDAFAPGSNATMTVKCKLTEKENINKARVTTTTGDYNEDNDEDECEVTVGELPPIKVKAVGKTKTYGSELVLGESDYILEIDGTNGTEKVESITVSFTNAANEVAYPTNKTSSVGKYGIYLDDLKLSPATTREIIYVPGELEVTKKALTIKANNQTKTYGQAVTMLTPTKFCTITGLVEGDEIDKVTRACDGAAATADVGEYDIIPSEAKAKEGTNLDNYEITYDKGTLTVNPFKITITAADTNKVYGTSLELDPTAFKVASREDDITELPNGEAITSVTMTSTEATDPKTAAGEYEDKIILDRTSVKGTDDFDAKNYDIEFKDGTLTVDQAEIKIIANPQTKTYGESRIVQDTEFTYEPKTLPNGDQVTTVSMTCAELENPKTDAGTYEGKIIVDKNTVQGNETFDTANYKINVVNGILTVDQAELVITANLQTKTYGESRTVQNTEFTYEPTTLPNGDKVINVDISCPGLLDSKTAVGEHLEAVIPDGAKVTGNENFKAANYKIEVVKNKLSVTQKLLTIIADNAEKVYGETKKISNAAFTYDPKDLPNDEVVTSVEITCEEAEDPKTDAGDYEETVIPDASTVKGNDAFNAANYKIVVENGNLTVTKANLEIIAKPATKPYGKELKFDGTEFTTNPADLPNDDDVTSVTITSSKAADPKTEVGEYDNAVEPKEEVIGNADFKKGNYDIKFTKGKLTVTKKPLKILADPLTKIYGETKEILNTAFKLDPTTELAEGEQVTSVTLASEKAAATTTPAGTYEDAIVFAEPKEVKGNDAFDAKNYNIEVVPGDLTVTQKALTIKPKNQTKIYGQSVALLKAASFCDITGLVDGDEITQVTRACEGAAATAAVEEYEITASDPVAKEGTNLDNYEITYDKGTLTVNPFKITITAADTNKVYGTTIELDQTAFTVTKPEDMPDFPKDETITSVTMASTEATDPKTGAGDYPGSIVIDPDTVMGENTFDKNNYDIKIVNGNLTVDQAELEIIANPLTRGYGTAKPFDGTEFTTNPEDLPNDEEITFVTLAGTKAVDAKTAVGEYDDEIVPSEEIKGNADFKKGNYKITFTKGKLTVTKKPLKILADPLTKIYGETKEILKTAFKLDPTTELAEGEQVTSVTLASEKAAAATTPAGTYEDAIAFAVPYEVKGNDAFDAKNYNIEVVPGDLTVTQKALTIKPKNQTKIYGQSVTLLKAASFCDTTGLVDGDEITQVTRGCEGAAATAAVDEYEITASNPVAKEGTNLDNYEITYDKGTYTVNPFKITITAADTNKVYGTTIELDQTAFTVTKPEDMPDFPKDETITSVTMTSTEATDPKTEVGEYKLEIVPNHEVLGINGFSTNNYEIAFSNGTLTVTQAVLTIAVNDATWKVGKPKPDYHYLDFTDQLNAIGAGDTALDITGGAESYSNTVWETALPKEQDEGTYEKEIWLTKDSLKGGRAANYDIVIVPGALEIVAGEAKLEPIVTTGQNMDTGYKEGTLTITNKGDGEVEPDFDYWIQLKPGPAGTTSRGVHVPKTWYLESRDGTVPDGYDYMNLTARVKDALKRVGNHDEVFDPTETITLTGISVYHWKRYNLEKFVNNQEEPFFVAGKLFNEADKDNNFIITEAEKSDAKNLLGENSDDYLEVTRLELLKYYRWKSADGKLAEGAWDGPKKEAE